MQRRLIAVYVSAVAVTYGSPDYISHAAGVVLAGVYSLARFCWRKL